MRTEEEDDLLNGETEKTAKSLDEKTESRLLSSKTRREEAAKARFYKRKVIELAAELAGLRMVGHARARGVEVRLERAGTDLAYAFFALKFGIRLSCGRIGPDNEHPDSWHREN